jgi:hypothetical protein
MFVLRWPVGGRATLCRAFVAGLVIAGSAGSLTWAAAESAASKIPDFQLGPDMAWREIGDEFLPPPSGPGPITEDPEHPFRSNGAVRLGQQPTYHIGDLTNPILQPWAAEQMRKDNEAVLAGGVAFRPNERCMPGGVPEFVLIARISPFYFLQTPGEVTIFNQNGPEIRRIFMDVPHSANVKPSWYGESVGHYEGGDTLVVDTIGISAQSYVDNFRTPHTGKLHVIERFKISADRKSMEDFVTVDDPGAFTTQWSGIQRFRLEKREMRETVCAENNVNFFGKGALPMPVADKPDF